jgi:8-oxo-dGTP diphosphatase
MVLFEIHVYGVLIHKNKVLFLKSQTGLKKFMFPGGILEDGETLQQCLEREVLEETNLKFKSHKLVFAETLYTKKVPQIGIIFSCQTDFDQVKLSDEHNKYLWVDENDFLKVEIAHPVLIDIARLALQGLNKKKHNQLI